MKTRRQYDEAFKKMAVDLSIAKGSLKITADELGIRPQILTRWRRKRVASQVTGVSSKVKVSQEQQEILRLKKEPLRRPVAHATRYIPAVSIFSKSDGTFFNS